MTGQIAYLALSVLIVGVLSNGAAWTVPRGLVRCGTCQCHYQHRHKQHYGEKYIWEKSCDDNTTVVDVRGQNITLGPLSFHKLGNKTTELILSHNVMWKIDWGHYGYRNMAPELRTLKLDHNQFFVLDPTIFDFLLKLEHVDFSSNSLTYLFNHTFDKLLHLTELHLGNNSLSSLPNNLFAFNTKLERLSLNNNLFAHLQTDLFRPLTALRHLDLSHNLFAALGPDMFKGLARLQVLSLADNSLTTLPERILVTNTGLRYITLQRNSITHLARQTFVNMRFPEIFLDENSISSLSNFDGPFNRDAMHVSLSNNPLRTLPANLFKGNSLLVRLYLDNLHFDGLDVNWFKDLRALRQLSLRNCSLKTLPKRIFESLRNLRDLDLRDNNDLRGYSPAMLANSRMLTNAGLQMAAWTFSLDSFWTKHGVPFTSHWYYGLRLDFETMIKIIRFSEIAQRRCGDGPLLILPGRFISFACNCSQGKVFNGQQCVDMASSTCSPAPFPRRGACDMYPSCTANRSITTLGRSAEHCTCPPNTVLVQNPCVQGEEICDTGDRLQCTAQPACGGRKTHICVCPSHTATMSCLPHGHCTTHGLKTLYPGVFDQLPTLMNGQRYAGTCPNGPGNIDFTCNNGKMQVMQKCSCDVQHLQNLYPSALRGITTMNHNEVISRTCPNSITQAGHLRFTCYNGNVTIRNQDCSCLTDSVLSSHPSVFHAIRTMKYTESISIVCPGTVGGTIVFQCIAGGIRTIKNCSCSTSHLPKAFPDLFTMNSVPVTTMVNTQTLQDTCPSGGTIAFTCNNGNITVINNCKKLKCGGYDLIYTTPVSVAQPEARNTCTMLGGTLPNFISYRDHCLSTFVKSVSAHVWLDQPGVAETLPGYIRSGPKGQVNFSPYSRLSALPFEPVRFFCQYPHRRHHCGNKKYYLVPALTVHDVFVMRNYRQANEECQQRGLVLPGVDSDVQCTQDFLRNVSSLSRGSTWLRSSPTRGDYWATDIHKEFMFPGASPLAITICAAAD